MSLAKDVDLAFQLAAERSQLIKELLELAKQYASECGECNGTGIADSWVENVPEDITKGVHKEKIDCPECADIRAMIAKAKGKV